MGRKKTAASDSALSWRVTCTAWVIYEQLLTITSCGISTADDALSASFHCFCFVPLLNCAMQLENIADWLRRLC